MFSKRTLLILGAVAAVSIVLVNAAPTVSVVESGLALREAAPVTETSIAERSAGTMGNYFDKRISLGLYTVNIGVLGTFTGYSCMAFIAAPVNAITGTFCAAGIIATLGYLIASHWIVATGSTRRDATISDPRYHGNIVLNFPQIEGKTATHSMKTAYSAFNETGKMLVGYHDCETTHCYNLYYENYEHPTIGVVHKLSQHPRGSWGNSTTSKRSPQEYADEMASEDSETASDGTVMYGTYIYWDTDSTDENSEGNSNSGDDIADALFDAASTDSDFENQGYMCVNIIDNSDSGAVPSTGYLSATAGENTADPDNEQTNLETCYDDEFGKRRRARRSFAA